MNEGDSNALQRYVIAYAEREEARRRMSQAEMCMRAEVLDAVRELRAYGFRERKFVSLLDGRRFEVFADEAGIVVLEPQASGAS